MVRHISKLIVAAAVFGLLVCWAESKKNCKAELKESGLIPEYGDSNTNGNLKVVYPGNNPMKCGNKISILNIQQAPTVRVDLTNVCNLTSIIMFDPDIPVSKGYVHWLVANVPTTDLKNTYAGKGSGKTYADYMAPGTPTGDHRYTICVYCQQGQITCKKYTDPVQKVGFDPREFAQEKSLGSPKSCNFMYLVATSEVQLDSKPKLNPKVA